ncbi:MAG: hypothetical protein R3F15_18085 [Lysobacterales bacterium]
MGQFLTWAGGWRTLRRRDECVNSCESERKLKILNVDSASSQPLSRCNTGLRNTQVSEFRAACRGARDKRRRAQIFVAMNKEKLNESQHIKGTTTAAGCDEAHVRSGVDGG